MMTGTDTSPGEPDVADIMVANPRILSGVPCFRGTRIPVTTVFDNLATGMTLEEILTQWPTLNRADVLAVLAHAGRLVERYAA